MRDPNFIHLHVHTEYSIINGLSKINCLIDKAIAYNMPAIAITDFTNLYGIIKFYTAAHLAGIKPIIGVDFYLEDAIVDTQYSSLTILAKNNQGYKNLILLISQAYANGYGDIGPTIKRDWLVKHKEGLILLSGGCNGDIGKLLLHKDKKLLKKYLSFYETYFHNNYYIELIRTGRINEEEYNNYAINLASEKNIPVVATNDVCFIDSSDYYAHEIRVAIHDGYILNNHKRSNKYSKQQYLRNSEEMLQLFSDIPEALFNSVEIAKRCNVTISLGKYFLPKLLFNKTEINSLLIQTATVGLQKRLKLLYSNPDIRNDIKDKYYLRLNSELEVINKMGFPAYFLIVMEFIEWSKNNGIPVGPGRGSGAGSLVAYALNITDLDPIKFDLIFERFLNPERISLPDFDIDFCMVRRDEVIEHVSKLYGKDSVSQIITFGTMAARAAIKDVGRVLGYPYGFVDRISKLIPSDIGITIKKAFILEPQLRALYDNDDEIKLIIDMACKLEGIIRNAGKHAGGVVISPTKITDFSPIYCDAEGKNSLTQFDKNDIESVGLVKFDFLGLKTLTIINYAVNAINNGKLKNKIAPININLIPLNDQHCFNLLQRGETTGIFQLESYGIKELIKRLRPDCFEDIVALVALFRPGPLQSGMVDNFINRKHGKELIYYPDINWQHSLLKPVLESTYGIILYQEQVMKIAQVLAGYSLADADMLRIAISKKNTAEMIAHRKIFQSGAIKNGIDSNLAMKIFDLLEKFANYGFNKSHSVAYALISYQTLWLKTYYPAEFMAAAMTADMDNVDKLVCLIHECRRIGLKILLPDINIGLYNFHVNEKGEIVYGLGAIKGVGIASIKTIISLRENCGIFKNFFDFCIKVCNKKINRRVIEKLILSGACDILGIERINIMNSLDDIFIAVEQIVKKNNNGQEELFDDINDISYQKKYLLNKKINKWSKHTILHGERETLGLYLTSHPINIYLSEIKYYTNNLTLQQVSSISQSNKTLLTVVGLILNIKIITNKYNNKFAICIINDNTSDLEIFINTKLLNNYNSLLKKDLIVIVSGLNKFDKYRGINKLIVTNIMSINEARNIYIKYIAILLVHDVDHINKVLINLENIINQYQLDGLIPIKFFHLYKNCIRELQLEKTFLITPTDTTLSHLYRLFGSKYVKLKFK
uniref:DNA polymerase III subunit alpha n=1 Tax=Candidatus Aschnera chinzeii TaxID=1485666 RepID=A0AAT9G3Y8_9ENTR|nr:MAG: DNA polymerase III subunit alpha [Candidatus Aschnera chinzeii]